MPAKLFFKTFYFGIELFFPTVPTKAKEGLHGSSFLFCHVSDLLPYKKLILFKISANPA